MNKFLYFFSLFSAVFAALFLFFHDSDFSLENDTSVAGYSNTVRNEIDFLNRTLNSFAGKEDSLQMQELILLSGITIKKNIDSITPFCDKAVALKINDFTLKVMESIGSLASTEVSPDDVKMLKKSLEKDGRVLSNIVQLASEKYSEKNKSQMESGFIRVKDNLKYLVFFFLILSLIMTGTAFFNENRLKRLAERIGLEGDLSKESTEKALRNIKGDSEERLQELERKLEREQMVGKRKDVLFDAIPAGLFSCDTKGYITLMNSKIKSWFGIEDDLFGEDVSNVFASMEIAADHRDKFTYKGDVFWISEYGSSSESFYVVTNITEQEEMARKLLDSERLVSIGEMASRITHEIRNPLSTVKLNSEYMVENIGKMSSNDILSSLNLIVHEVERLESITEKYMDIVRYRNNEESETLVNIPVDLVQFSTFHSPEFKKRNIDISLEADAECTLSMTLSSFKEIMLNLYKNAWEELENGGKLRVAVTVNEKVAVVSVEDSGRGVSEEEKKKVFKNFYTNKPGGTGIGLSHSRKLAEEAGGSLVIEDSDLGGAKMVLEIPLKV